jgi:subtilisin family serine protease
VPTLDEASLPAPSASGITRSPSGSWVRGRILVAPSVGLSDADFDTVLSGVGAQSKRKLNGLNVHVIELPASSHGNEQAIARALSNNPHVKFAEVDEVVSLSATTNDPILGSEWHISKIGAQTAWNSSIGQNVVVAVIDTGVQLTHPDLYANLVAGWNAYDNNSNADDVYGHGTAVAGTIAAVGNNAIGVVGVAYGARIMPIRATDAAANSSFSVLASALTWAADHGADVANISFSNIYKSSTMQAAAQYLRDRGGVTVVSANNNAIDEGSSNTTTMITVSATDQNDLLASFSSWGSMVDLAAPGVTIQTTLWNSGYGWGTGTSFATPIVAGAVALVMAANYTLAPSQVESALFSNATDLGSGGYDTKYGWGRVNVASAVQAALGAPASDTTKPTVAIASPTGGTLAGLVPVSVSASDNVGVTRVELYAGGTLIGSDTTPPYSFSWDTTQIANSSYSLSALAYDAAGNVGTSAAIAVTVSNAVASPPPPVTPTIDSAPPVVAIGNPKNGQRVKGNVPIQASAVDNVGVQSIGLYVDGSLIATGNSTSLTANWNASKAWKGTHTIKAVATDAAGNSGSVTISVNN